MQIKTTVRYHYIHIIMSNPRTLITPSTGKDVEQQEFSLIACGKAKWCRHLIR